MDKTLKLSQGPAKKPQSAPRIVAWESYVENANEDTILNNLLPLVTQPEYMNRNTLDSSQEHYVEGDQNSVMDGNCDMRLFAWIICVDWFKCGGKACR